MKKQLYQRMYLLHFTAFLCMYLLVSATTYAQTLYTILVADGSEHKHNGHFYNLKRLQLETDTIANFANLEKKEFVIDETSLTRYSIDSVLANIRPTKKDVIFFYFSGNEYLQKVSQTDKQVLKLKDGYIEYEQLQKILKAKNAKLTLLFVDLCNRISADRLVNMKVAPAKKEKYSDLFQQAQGDISVINHFPYEQHELITTIDGTIFTNGIVHALHEDRKDSRWEAVISRAKYLTISESAGKQNPQALISLKNLEVEPKNIISTVSEGHLVERVDKSEKIDKPVKLRTENNGNFNAPTNTTIQVEKGVKKTDENNITNKNTKGGNFDKKSDAFVEEITPDKQAMLNEKSLAMIGDFQNKIATIALGSSSNNSEGAGGENGKSEADLIESAMLLFSDNTKEIGISSVKRGVVRKKVKKYFRKLYGIGNAYKIAVTWYQPTEITPLEAQTDGTYKTMATVYQEFRKTNKSGKLVYGDRVTKKISLTLKPDNNEENGWKVVINDIEVVAGTTEQIKE